MTKTEATIADLTIAASMTGPHELMEIPRVRVVELLDEIKRLRAIEQRAQMVDEGRPARPDRHVALALSTRGGPSPQQAAVTAYWILTGESK